jgi:hypothetical protein
MESNNLYEHAKVNIVLAFMSAQLSSYYLCNAGHRKLLVISANTQKKKKSTALEWICAVKREVCVW